MVRVLFIGDVEPQASAVWGWLAQQPEVHVVRELKLDGPLPDLTIVAGYRRLVPKTVLDIPRLGTVGFHSARLPEYPGRAPVPWALLRGDPYTENTMFYLDEGIDSGDIIDRRRIDLRPTDTPERVYRRMAITCVEMLEANWQGLITGTAPRTPQDVSKRGPLTTKDGWDRLNARQPAWVDAFG
jgi:methionyl-tRNA formyltransferase